MGANFVRLTVVADDNQLDVSLPAQRPVVEYIDDVLGLLGPTASAGGAVWTLSTPALGPIDLEDTLADHQIVDGARLHLTKAPEAAPPPFVDDVLAEMRRGVDARFRTWDAGTRRTWIGVSVGVVVALASAVVAGDDARQAVVGVLGGLALLCLLAGAALRGPSVGNAAWVAVIPASLGMWRAAEELGTAEQVAFTVAVGCAVVASAAAIVLRSSPVSIAACATAGGCSVAGGAFLAGANAVAMSVWVLPVLVVAVIVAPKWALASSGLLAQVRLSERMELADRDAVARGLTRGRLTADVLVWSSSVLGVLAVATIAADGVWEQGLAAAIMVAIWLLRSRNFTHARHVAPMILAAAASTVFLAAGAIRWFGAAGSSYVLGIGAAVVVLVLVLAACALPTLDEVTAARVRRLLDAVDIPLAVAFVPVVFFAQGVYTLVWPR
ncbi:EsaB/YukD family protein [Gordonia sp. PDNC005]|uniref:EsaB/YukD family protein n=1 Tax=unclassified Gordonia (in: high G+C Gram-positive bacteria) TaxID=2657482 RepID=UPI001965540E|nr:EsaB/YukD family protein [Gordonia sp. PDNC005]QRY63011.1 EsaB/YukD family protein [Gordonia sp. PDNC005]